MVTSPPSLGRSCVSKHNTRRRATFAFSVNKIDHPQSRCFTGATAAAAVVAVVMVVAAVVDAEGREV